MPRPITPEQKQAAEVRALKGSVLRIEKTLQSGSLTPEMTIMAERQLGRARAALKRAERAGLVGRPRRHPVSIAAPVPPLAAKSQMSQAEFDALIGYPAPKSGGSPEPALKPETALPNESAADPLPEVGSEAQHFPAETTESVPTEITQQLPGNASISAGSIIAAPRPARNESDATSTLPPEPTPAERALLLDYGVIPKRLTTNDPAARLIFCPRALVNFVATGVADYGQKRGSGSRRQPGDVFGNGQGY